MTQLFSRDTSQFFVNCFFNESKFNTDREFIEIDRPQNIRLFSGNFFNKDE